MDRRFDDDDWEEARRALDGLDLDEIEIKVARLVAGCLTNERIAADLDVKLAKVKWILRCLFIKLRVSDRHALAQFVDARLTALRKREARRRPAPRERPELRLLEKPRKTPRARPGPPGGAGEPRAAP